MPDSSYYNSDSNSYQSLATYTVRPREESKIISSILSDTSLSVEQRWRKVQEFEENNGEGIEKKVQENRRKLVEKSNIEYTETGLKFCVDVIMGSKSK